MFFIFRSVNIGFERFGFRAKKATNVSWRRVSSVCRVRSYASSLDSLLAEAVKDSGLKNPLLSLSKRFADGVFFSAVEISKLSWTQVEMMLSIGDVSDPDRDVVIHGKCPGSS
ncbi:hypothetical protein HAX54_041356 [Datura stramonium]|uniref:Uncharacterized protein n=1 Tax=Datura stramonium TaxID=4076 RepID=A0ABS8VUF7_DATST|nr:hypothetical protein [Datura stramonium]